MRREDKIAFITTLTTFSLLVILVTSISNTLLTPPSSKEKMCFPVQITAIYQEKVLDTPRKVVKKRVKPSVKKVLAFDVKAKKLIKVDKVKRKEKKEVLKTLAKLEKVIPKKAVPAVNQKKSEVKAEKQKEQVLDKMIVQKQVQFFKHLKEVINENKNYPRMARIRSLEGDVKVSFTLFENGSMKIKKLKGKKLFTKSSERALLDTFPIKIPKELQLHFPLNLNIELKYHIA